MKKRHEHQWVEIVRIYVPPIQNITNFKSSDPDQLDRILFGVTSIELRCPYCGDISERQLIGDHT